MAALTPVKDPEIIQLLQNAKKRKRDKACSSSSSNTYKNKFSNEPGSDPLLAWKRASWVQETCLLIQAAVLRTASRLFHRGLRVCFKEDYEHLFDVPQHSRTDNDVSGLAPIYIPAAG